jgi:hypothetical protein
MRFIYQKTNFEHDWTEIMKAFSKGAFGGDNLLGQIQTKKQSNAPYLTHTHTLEFAIDFVCNHCRISRDELSNPSRKKELVNARALLALIAHKAKNWNFEDLVRFYPVTERKHTFSSCFKS